MKFGIFIGLSVVFMVACNTAENTALKSQEQGKLMYQEKYRPQFHFSPKEKWMNDPNGMVYFDGEYHLFYQYYPDSTVWGPMHWGHAISKDLVHWEHLPIAIYPDSLGYIFSGSAVYDKNNTSGLGTTEKPPLVAIFTYHDPVMEKEGSDLFQTQGIAYSTDKGRTWTKYEGNPVLNNPGIRDFRDPKVMWHKPSEKWVMSLAVKDHISFYSSSNLINWTHESDFGKNMGAHGGVWECPDLFKLTFDEIEKWVLLVSINPGGPNGGSATQYFIGDFDGKVFKTDQKETLWLDYGSDNYAGVTWSNVPINKTLFIGWMSNWDYANIVPTERWRSAMTIVRELEGFNEGEIFKVKSKPIDQLKKLRSSELDVPGTIEVDQSYTFNSEVNLSEILMTVEQNSSDTVEFIFENDADEAVVLKVVPASNGIIFDRSATGNTSFSDKFVKLHQAPFNFASSTYQIHIFKDETSVEVFINDGELVITELFFSHQPLNKFTVKTNDSLLLKNIEVYSLSSIWK